MFTTKNHDDKIEELRKQLAAAEAERLEQQRQAEKALRAAMKHAGENHSRLVLALYDLLDIEPEHGTVRIVKGRQSEVAVDKDETVRTQRCYDIIGTLVEGTDASVLNELKLTDEMGREERKPKPKDLAPQDQGAIADQDGLDTDGEALDDLPQSA